MAKPSLRTPLPLSTINDTATQNHQAVPGTSSIPAQVQSSSTTPSKSPKSTPSKRPKSRRKIWNRRKWKRKHLPVSTINDTGTQNPEAVPGTSSIPAQVQSSVHFVDGWHSDNKRDINYQPTLFLKPIEAKRLAASKEKEAIKSEKTSEITFAKGSQSFSTFDHNYCSSDDLYSVNKKAFDKDHGCPHCCQTFRTMSLLKQHKETHAELVHSDHADRNLEIDGFVCKVEEQETYPIYPFVKIEHFSPCNEDVELVEVKEDDQLVEVKKEHEELVGGKKEDEELVEVKEEGSCRNHSDEHQSENLQSDGSTFADTSSENCMNIMTLQKCPVCDVNCWSKETLIAHMETHPKIEPNVEAKKRTHSESESETEHLQIEGEEDLSTINSLFASSQSKGFQLCKLCGAQFIDTTSRQLHVKKMHPVCVQCGFSFRDDNSLEEHKKTHSEAVCQLTKETLKCNRSLKFVCSLCKIEFVYQKVLRDHILQKGHYKCYNCESNFESKSVLAIHMLQHKSCTLCQQVLTKTSLYSHMQSRHPKCSICESFFCDEESLIKHSKVHPQCTICEAQLFDQTALEYHMNSHPQCLMCKLYFKNQKLMAKHNTSLHRQCKICYFVFKDETLLNLHMNSHPKCKLCDCQFENQRFLEVHMDSYPHCNVCKHKFINTDCLRKHKIDQGHFRCNYCESYFHNEQSVVAHEMSHMICHMCPKDPKSYQWHAKFHHICSVCKNQFKNIEMLIKHRDEEGHLECNDCDLVADKCSILTHSCTYNRRKDLPQCKMCGSCFFKRAKLDEHIRGVHPYCLVCTRAFQNPKTLYDHKVKEGHRYCNQCFKDLNNETMFNAHCKIHPMCTVCKIHFKEQKHLEFHMKTHIAG